MNELTVEESKTITLMPKGLIFFALGGYVGEEKGLNSRENSDKVIIALTEYMQKSDRAIMAFNGKLHFVAVKEKKRKKFLGIF